jgi:hypothetical protein
MAPVKTKKSASAPASASASKIPVRRLVTKTRNPASKIYLYADKCTIPCANALPATPWPEEYVRKKVASAIREGCAYAEHIAVKFDPHPAVYRERTIEISRDADKNNIGKHVFHDWNEALFESVAKECLALGYLAVFLDLHYKILPNIEPGVVEFHVPHVELVIYWSADTKIQPGFHKRRFYCSC